MSTVDLSKIKVGDEVTVWMRVLNADFGCQTVRLRLGGPSDASWAWSDRWDIVSHTPARPKPLQVGDLVKFIGNPDSVRGVIRAIDDDYALVRWIGAHADYYCAENLCPLERVEP